MKHISDIFDITYGNKLDFNKCIPCQKGEGFNFVNRSDKNCGVSGQILEIENEEPFAKGLITVAMGGSVLASFVQQESFYTGQNVKVLIPKSDMTTELKIYYCFCIEANKYKFSTFGREANYSFNSLLVPDNNELPEYINQYNAEIMPFIKKPFGSTLNLETGNWQWFSISTLFDVCGSKTTKLDVLKTYGHGEYPYVTTQSANNGVNCFFDYWTEEGNILVIDSAVAGFCSYQENNFSASDHVEKLIPHFPMNKYIAIFLVTIINLDNYRYNYGRKFNQKNIKKALIKLPILDNGTPDWDFMENYVKGLPYSQEV